eukprot:2341087-Alexandrium_andersonii.AAC.1
MSAAASRRRVGAFALPSTPTSAPFALTAPWLSVEGWATSSSRTRRLRPSPPRSLLYPRSFCRRTALPGIGPSWLPTASSMFCPMRRCNRRWKRPSP